MRKEGNHVTDIRIPVTTHCLHHSHPLEQNKDHNLFLLSRKVVIYTIDIQKDICGKWSGSRLQVSLYGGESTEKSRPHGVHGFFLESRRPHPETVCRWLHARWIDSLLQGWGHLDFSSHASVSLNKNSGFQIITNKPIQKLNKIYVMRKEERIKKGNLTHTDR